MTALPVGSCDTHIHVYDSRYPSSPRATLFPPDASGDDYRAVQRTIGTDRVVLVQPSTYGLDNTCQIDAARSFGESARLVVVVDEHTPTDELERLTSLGARGARFHMLPGGAVDWASLRPVADRIAPLGWHIQLQMDGNRLGDHLDTLLGLPVPLVVDHVGRFMPPPPAESEAVDTLVRLLDTGRCWVKLSAPYESTDEDDPDHPRVSAIARRLVRHAPERMLWATNWPHPGRSDPPTPADLMALLDAWVPSDTLRRAVLVDNPATLYGFEPVTPTSP
jgi:D-galactarolactone isomerase